MQRAVSIAYYTGLRIGEVLGLKWSQVDLGEGKLSLTPLQTKTETSRVVYLPPDLHRVLLEAKRRHEGSYPSLAMGLPTLREAVAGDQAVLEASLSTDGS